MKRGKKYAEAKVKVDNTRPTPVNDAVKMAKELSFAKFDESVELHFATSADPRHADQQMREVAELPHGTGAQVRVMVFAEGDAARTAEEAGADFIADNEIIKRIEGGWSDFDVSIATPDQMGKIGRLGRYLGRKGLMPNPRTGTVVQAQDIPKAIESSKKGRAEVRLDRTANIHARIGKVSFTEEQLMENLASVYRTVRNAKPSGVKGQFVTTATVTTTMGPGIRMDLASLDDLANQD